MQVRAIEILPMRQAEIDLLIVNNPGYNFGLIGFAIAEANRSPKSKWLKSQAATAGLDPVEVFKSAFDSAMRENGYALHWSEPVMEGDNSATRRDSSGMRKSYTVSTHDAQLGVNFGFIGYAAAGSGDSAPYRLTAVLSARLLSADGRRVLFEDQIIYNSVFPGRPKAITLNPDSRYRYPDFDDLEAAGATAVEGLPYAFTAVAQELARQLKP
ncbi:MAG: hypothetical protein ABI650_04550 [Dokdonella sp.]